METELVPRDDESEALRVRDANGIGDIILTEEDVRAYSLNDFNGGFPPDIDQDTYR